MDAAAGCCCASALNPYRGNFVQPPAVPAPRYVFLDAFWQQQIVKAVAPCGVLSVYASSRLSPDSDEGRRAERFARLWAEARPDVPVLTGGGPGLMTAVNRGAAAARTSPSMGFNAYLNAGANTGPDQQLNAFVTPGAGRVNTDFDTRERGLFRYARGFVAFDGGFGTTGELLLTLSGMSAGVYRAAPIVVASAKLYAALQPLFAYFVLEGTASAADVARVRLIEEPRGMVAYLSANIGAPPFPPPAGTG